MMRVLERRRAHAPTRARTQIRPYPYAMALSRFRSLRTISSGCLPFPSLPFPSLFFARSSLTLSLTLSLSLSLSLSRFSLARVDLCLSSCPFLLHRFVPDSSTSGNSLRSELEKFGAKNQLATAADRQGATLVKPTARLSPASERPTRKKRK
jgi:hypothetical protein